MQEHAMTFDAYHLLNATGPEFLERALARRGFTPAQTDDLLDCELNLDHLLEYITAVISERMN
jgi:hypothetical protein